MENRGKKWVVSPGQGKNLQVEKCSTYMGQFRRGKIFDNRQCSSLGDGIRTFFHRE